MRDVRFSVPLLAVVAIMMKFLLLTNRTCSYQFRYPRYIYRRQEMLNTMKTFNFLTTSAQRRRRISIHRSYLTSNDESLTSSYKYRVYLAVGSNLGDRFQNIHKALRMLEEIDGNETVQLIRTSFLYETKPMYVTDQPPFLNGVVEIQTSLDPSMLLQNIKRVETNLGRDFSTIRNGPRPVDLDILIYDEMNDDFSPGKSILVDSDQLIIPHPRIQERDFVLVPFIDVTNKDYMIPNTNLTLMEALLRLQPGQHTNTSVQVSAVRVLPLPRRRLLYFNETIIMGILNVTPDSFSDGGQWTTGVDVAVNKGLSMEKEGATIIDVGGESTRPGAVEISVDEQLRRTIPVIEGIRKKSDVIISIDTRHAKVAAAAIEAGADIVNDVSGGTFDSGMFSTVAKLGVPMILMHMRGTPKTMQAQTSYDDVVEDVSQALLTQSTIASEQHSIHRWMQVVDPGIGFAKDLRGNLLLLKNMGRIRSKLQDLPVLLGTSRKGFIGTLTSVPEAQERDPGSIASCIVALCLEDNQISVTPKCTILRVHNVAHCRQATLVMDAILNVH